MTSSQLRKILLVDDDEATNFLHRIIIEEVGCCEVVDVREDGVELLDYLRDNSPLSSWPDLLFLDINMPRMDGWQFLEHYSTLDPSLRDDMVIVILSTSVNPDDIKRAKAHEMVHEFMSKPLTPEKLNSLVESYF